MAVKHLPAELGLHKNKWVALSLPEENEVVGVGATPEAAIAAARSKGHDKESVVLIFVPLHWPQALVV